MPNNIKPDNIKPDNIKPYNTRIINQFIKLIKQIKFDIDSSKNKKEEIINNEKEILINVKHPYIVKLDYIF